MNPTWSTGEPECPGVTEVHEHPDGTWWWYDETCAWECGPFETEQSAKDALAVYIVNL